MHSAHSYDYLCHGVVPDWLISSLIMSQLGCDKYASTETGWEETIL